MEALDLETGELVLESRVVCAGFGSIGHHEHKFVKETPELCVQYAKKLTVEMMGTRDAAVELPYRIQIRRTSAWNDIDVS